MLEAETSVVIPTPSVVDANETATKKEKRKVDSKKVFLVAGALVIFGAVAVGSVLLFNHFSGLEANDANSDQPISMQNNTFPYHFGEEDGSPRNGTFQVQPQEYGVQVVTENEEDEEATTSSMTFAPPSHLFLVYGASEWAINIVVLGMFWTKTITQGGLLMQKGCENLAFLWIAFQNNYFGLLEVAGDLFLTCILCLFVSTKQVDQKFSGLILAGLASCGISFAPFGAMMWNFSVNKSIGAGVVSFLAIHSLTLLFAMYLTDHKFKHTVDHTVKHVFGHFSHICLK